MSNILKPFKSIKHNLIIKLIVQILSFFFRETGVMELVLSLIYIALAIFF
jgi:hypothetical protein